MSAHLENIVQARLDAIISGNEALELPLFGEEGQTVGVMHPLTVRYLNNMAVIEKLTNWRNENMSNFLTHFTATPARTQSWLQNIYLKIPGQMLWLIYDQDNRLIGHFGFKNLNEKSVLLDNAIRGERQGHPKIFVFAGRSLVKWLWVNTSVLRIQGIVISDNIPAIMMNRQIGFQGWKLHPLINRNLNGEIHWDIGEEGCTSPDCKYCFNLFIERESNEWPTD